MARRRRQPVLPPYLRPLNNAQIRQQANQQLADLYGPQQKQLEDEQRSRAATIQASSQAAAQLLAQHAGIAGDAYAQANQELQGIGSGYSDAMKARIQAAQDSAGQFAKLQGAPASAPTVDATALGDTVYHGGVAIPGSSLASQGAAASAAAGQLAGIPLLQGAQDIRQSDMDYEKQLTELARQKPELRQKILETLYNHEMQKLDARLKQQAQDLYQQQFGEKVAHDTATENAANRRNQISYQNMVNNHQEAVARAQAAGRELSSGLSSAFGYIVDKQGHPVLDKNGNKIPVAKNNSAKSQKAKNNAQYQKAVGEAASMFGDSQPGAPSQPGLPPTPAKREWKWGQAIRYLMNRYGIPRSRARQALVTAGFKPPSTSSVPRSRGPNNSGPR